MDYGLKDRLVLITGGTSGIGLATAQLFLAAGARVVIAARDRARGQAALESLGGGGDFLECDVSQPSSVEGLVSTATARHGRLHCAVNCAAVSPVVARIHEARLQDIGELIDTDILGQFLCMKAEIETLLGSGGGTIVNVSSVNGLSGTPSAAMYSAGRHALLGLTRSAAKEYIAEGIRINAVCPGATDTPRRQRRVAHLPPEVQLKLAADTLDSIPIGRLATAAEIAHAILWLSSPLSSYVVGHSLVVDGGLSA